MAWLGLLIATASAWTLGDAHDLTASTSIDDPLFHWQIDRGTVFPIHDDHGDNAGFVWVGSGSVALELRDRTQLPTANRMVALMDWTDAQAEELAAGARLPSGVDGAVVLGLDAWSQIASEVRRIEGDDVVFTVDDDGMENVLVQRRSQLARAKRQASTWLERRERWWDEHLVEPAGLLVADRWSREAGLDTPPRWVASMHTDTDWGRFAGDTMVPRVVQPWLELLVDPTGVVSPGDRAIAWAFGHDDTQQRVVASEAFAGVGAPVRLDLVGSGATVRFDPSPASVALEMSASVDVAMIAVGGPAVTVVLDIPHTEQVSWRSMAPLPHGFELIEVTDSTGAPLEVVPVSIGRQHETRGDWRTFAIRLPEVIEPGETVTVRVRYRDRHRFSHLMETQVGAYNYGAVTDLLRVLPQLRGNTLSTAPAQIQVGVSPLLAEGVEAVSAGTEDQRWESETGRWVRATGVAGDMRVAAGKWHAEERLGTPNIAIRSLHGNRQQGKISRTVYQMLDLVQPMHPELPQTTLTVVEGASEVYETRIDAADGLIMHYEVQDGTEQLSTLDGARVLFALHQQWWTGLEVPPRDADLPKAVAQVYAFEAIRAVDGDRAAAEAWDTLRTFKDESVPLAWTLGPVLQARTGTPATLFAAVDRVLRGEFAPSREGLTEALEAVTGQSFAGFFTVWADTGLAPEVRVAWESSAGAISGTITSDLPFGRVDVPVRVGRGKRSREVVVAVMDGTGQFEVAWVGGKRGVRVDPHDALPLRMSRVHQVSGDAVSEVP